jgi:predicted aspartyl protease
VPNYDASGFDPPAPVAEVTLRNPTNGTTVSGIRLLIDTGADVTLLPRKAVAALGISTLSEHYELVGFDGSKTLSPVAVLDAVFLKRAFRGRYLLTPEDQGILGRDILNCVSLLLDGPRQQWSEPST